MALRPIFLGFLADSPPGKCYNCSLKQAVTAFSHIHLVSSLEILARDAIYQSGNLVK
jgi:hypothetical protein